LLISDKSFQGIRIPRIVLRRDRQWKEKKNAVHKPSQNPPPPLYVYRASPSLSSQFDHPTKKGFNQKHAVLVFLCREEDRMEEGRKEGRKEGKVAQEGYFLHFQIFKLSFSFQ
jgi:hypothetical protein